ncbi:MAG: (2Fe-2S)-binding protein [Mameliella sp.]|nr:(2Fe-2S)-binding protein [Mameliella sp.]
MIVCHCKNITDHDIRSAMEWMRAADPETLITPRKVYRALGKSADCGGCMPLFLDTLKAHKTVLVPNLRKPEHTLKPAASTEGSDTCKAIQKSSNI